MGRTERARVVSASVTGVGRNLPFAMAGFALEFTFPFLKNITRVTYCTDREDKTSFLSLRRNGVNLKAEYLGYRRDLRRRGERGQYYLYYIVSSCCNIVV